MLGRAAPQPTEPGRGGRPRLSPRFAEWMMGLPDGWVTALNLPRTAQLRALGNGVVPAQAELAISALATLSSHLSATRPHNDQGVPCENGSSSPRCIDAPDCGR
jgi:hypothetical protein